MELKTLASCFNTQRWDRVCKKLINIEKTKSKTLPGAHPQENIILETTNWVEFAKLAAGHYINAKHSAGQVWWFVLIAGAAYFEPMVAIGLCLILAVLNAYIAHTAMDASVLAVELADKAAYNVYEQHSMLHIDPLQHGGNGYSIKVLGASTFDRNAWILGSEYEINELHKNSNELYSLKREMRCTQE